MSIDLTGKSVEELKQFQDQVAAQLEETERNAVIDFYESIQKKCKALGFESIQDLHAKYLEYQTANKKKLKKGNVAPVYRSKINPENTWTGRGKHPRWLSQEAAQQGMQVKDLLESLLIQKD